MLISNGILPGLMTLPHDSPLEKIYEVLKRDGGVIVKDFASLDLVDIMNVKLQPFIDKDDIGAPLKLDTLAIIDAQDESMMAGNTYRIWGLLGKMPQEISAIMQDRIWAGVMEHILSQDTCDFYGTQMFHSQSSYTLNIANSFTVHPGAERQTLHRDQRAQMLEPDETGFTSMITCLIAGSNITKQNGATMVIPGSHLWGKERCGYPQEAVPAEMSKGSALFFLGSVMHGAGSNTCTPGTPDSVRQMFAVGACRDYYRPDECFLLSTPIDVVKALPKDVLKHTGWLRNTVGTGFVEFVEPFDLIDRLPLLSSSKV